MPSTERAVRLRSSICLRSDVSLGDFQLEYDAPTTRTPADGRMMTLWDLDLKSPSLRIRTGQTLLTIVVFTRFFCGVTHAHSYLQRRHQYVAGLLEGNRIFNGGRSEYWKAMREWAN
ncbi:hypothetical protein EVAR_29838_1 [Eumeta japonica]|uniref:Uncharacterized protein n=1 Tax=Eumeta variegata TaxID=151549 RepID=A0A4C1VU46_EUMVA|nr:hypothetical protein EVAR_29838_1 [Eumeta japonica]